MIGKEVSMIVKSLTSILVVIGLLLLSSCVNPDADFARHKLDLILPDDLKAIVEGIKKDALIDKPYYKITSFKTYGKGIYSAKAEVDFFFLKNVQVKIVRKFRYHRTKKMWERYFNEYQYFSDTTANVGKG